MPESRQAGFTLVELMVALLIGSIVVLGAGYLFFTTFQTFQKVDELSRKQETVIFAAHTLSDGIRQSEDGDSLLYDLQCEVNKDEDGQCQCTLRDMDGKNAGEPLLTFDGSWSKDDCEDKELLGDKGNLVKITLPLEKKGDSLKFRVAKRQPILEKYLDGDD